MFLLLLQANSLLILCLFLSLLSSILFNPSFLLFSYLASISLTCSISIFPPYPLFLLSSSWFFLVSFLWPPGDPATFWHCWPSLLCDCPWQMLPITMRNMPSISPLILKRLKVQFSLSPTCTPPQLYGYQLSPCVAKTSLNLSLLSCCN